MITITGLNEFRRDIAALSKQLQEAQHTGVTIEAGGGNEVKLVMLAATGRDFTAIDDEFESKISAIFEEGISAACARVGRGLSGSLVGSFHKVGAMMVNEIKRRVAAGEAPGGVAALSAKYAEWKGRKYPGKPIGEATGAMLRSLVAKVERR